MKKLSLTRPTLLNPPSGGEIVWMNSVIPVFEEGIGKPSEGDFIKAIENRNYVAFYYSRDSDGVLAGPRLVEPYCYGYRTLSNGETRYYLRAWMIKNSRVDKSIQRKKKKIGNRRSKSKSAAGNNGWSKASGWRLYRVDSITNFFNLERRFSYYRKGYNGSSDNSIPNIVVQCDKNAFYGEQPFN